MSATEFLILSPCWEEVYWNCCHDLQKNNLCTFLSLCSSYVWYESWQKLLRKKSMFPERKKLFPPLPGPLYPSAPLFSELGILKVQDVFKLHTSKFIYDCLSHSTPSLFWDWFTYNHSIHHYNTTSSCNIMMKNHFEIESIVQTNILHTQSSRLVNYGAKMVKMAGPLLWNSLPDNIRNSTSVHMFKNKLKSFLLGRYVSV